jgi:predicted nucleotidyltransferase
MALDATQQHRLEALDWPALGVEVRDGLYYLAGRAHLPRLHQQRLETATQKWAIARRFASLLHGWPGVRMIAVTGSLACDNTTAEADIDLLIVTRPGWVWRTLGVTLVLRRCRPLFPVRLCPNYIVSESRLALAERTPYAARELLQMAPLAGRAVYLRLLQENAWTEVFLPNAGPRADRFLPLAVERRAERRRARLERLYDGPVGDRLEATLYRLLARRFHRLAAGSPDAPALTPDVFKGHFDGQADAITRAFEARLAAHGLGRWADPA